MSAEVVASSTTQADLWHLVPKERHQKMFQLVDALAQGEGFELINDHNPRPLHHQLEVRHQRQLSWTRTESGPDVWRVLITRIVLAA